MKANTIDKLTTAATDLVHEFINDYESGHTTNEVIRKDWNSLNNKTPREFFKKTIRIDKASIQPVWEDRFGISLSNVMKSTDQFNFVADQVSNGLKQQAPRPLKRVLYYIFTGR